LAGATGFEPVPTVLETVTLVLHTTTTFVAITVCSLDYAFIRSGWAIIVSARPSDAVSLNIIILQTLLNLRHSSINSLIAAPI